jgi:hypothetical protein
MKIEASAGRYRKNGPSLHEHCERLVLRVTCEGEPQLLAAIYHGIAFGHWNRMCDLLDAAAKAAEREG